MSRSWAAEAEGFALHCLQGSAAPGSSLATLLSPGRATGTSPAAVTTPPVSDTADAARGFALSTTGSLPAGSIGCSIGGRHGGPGSSILSPGGSSLRSGGAESGDGSDVNDDDDDGSSDGDEGSTGGSPRAAAPGGMDVPEGFQFTGDLENDLDRLDALNQQDDQVSPPVGAALVVDRSKGQPTTSRALKCCSC